MTHQGRSLLRRSGVDIGYDTLRRYALAELAFSRSAPTVPVADYEPGEKVQLDTGWMKLLERDLFGERRRFLAWTFTAVRPRHRSSYPVFREMTVTGVEAREIRLGGLGRRVQGRHRRHNQGHRRGRRTDEAEHRAGVLRIRPGARQAGTER